MSLVRRARWLEPIGQACAAGAFAVQFFFLDPASSDLMAGYFNRESVKLSRIEQRLDGTYKPSPGTNVFGPTLDRLPIDVAIEERRRWRPWLITLFAAGALMTVIGKGAAIRYSTK